MNIIIVKVKEKRNILIEDVFNERARKKPINRHPDEVNYHKTNHKEVCNKEEELSCFSDFIVSGFQYFL